MRKNSCRNINLKRRVDTAGLEKVASGTLKFLKRSDNYVNIVVMSSQKIRVINRRYLESDRSTDVIAFSGQSEKMPQCEKGFLGDIAVSSDVAYKNAGKYGMSFKEELALYVVHGILHLCGYDDTSNVLADKMKKRENEIFGKIRRFI